MKTENEINELIEEIKEYQSTYGEDKVCMAMKANLFASTGDHVRSVKYFDLALKFDPLDSDLLYCFGCELINSGDLSLGCVKLATAAKQYKQNGFLEKYNQILSESKSFSKECKKIFDTILYGDTHTFVFLSICGYGEQKQRYQNFAVALAELGNKVVYVCPTVPVSIEGDVSASSITSYVISNMKKQEGIYIISPLYDVESKIDSYSAVVFKLSEMYKNAVFVVSNVGAYDTVLHLKGKNRIIFDCADDNSDFKNAFWSSEDAYEKEKKLVHLADDVLCTAASLFLKKYAVEDIKRVHLSQNAVCAKELNYGVFSEVPLDMLNIPKPIIGYVGFVYQRFDRELFYRLVEENPDKSFVLIGGIMDNYLELKYDNIYFLGSKKHSELEKYYKSMDICIIPYFDDVKMSMSCDPVKLHEHICCGIPTITTFMPDTAIDRPMVYHANTFEGVQKYIDKILNGEVEILSFDSNEYVARHSWISRATHLMRVVNNDLCNDETPENTLNSLKDKFDLIKDIHSNFRIIYALTLWNSDYDECYRQIELACSERSTEYNSEIREAFLKRKVIKNKSGKKVIANNIEKISVNDCTGCTSCMMSCPKKAISMVPDKVGFLYPKIDYSMCINCGLCFKKCPINNQVIIGNSSDECLALMSDSRTRIKSSSGGVFSVLAKEILSDGGYVCGAIYDEDFKVKHIVTNDFNDVLKMRGSKYVQSDMGDCYQKIADILKDDKQVLFTGCPCQVSGLYSYLDYKPDNLLTMSFVCAGVPSPKIFKQNLQNISKKFCDISKIDFRDKSKFGWDVGLYVEFNDKTNYIEHTDNSRYLEGFHSGIILRESCHSCKFKEDIYSDITVGDFWGINNIINFDDGLGTSYVSINTSKGKNIFSDLFLNFSKMAKIPKIYAVDYNPRIKSSHPRPVYKDLFLQNYMDTDDFLTAYEKTFTQKKFDVVLILWWSSNYGNAITNYALYHYLEKMNLSVLAVDNLTISPFNQFKDFSEKYFELSSKYFPRGSFKYISKCSDNYMVGSDQVWNKTFSYVMRDSGYFQLKFIADDKKKISYGSSFGQRSDAVEEDKLEYYKSLYKRFDYISLREKSGVEVMDDLFDVKAKYVLDPVFLLTKDDYADLISKIKVSEDKPFIVSYILTPNEEKKKYLLDLQQSLDGIEIINILDAEPCRLKENIDKFNIGKVKSRLSPEEWLYYLMNAEFVVTDSYHGTCFSIIFEKKFIAFVNREAERFDTFKDFSEIKDRIISTIPDCISGDIFDEIDYTNINSQLTLLRKESHDYLIDAL